jgi:hypothetical protein
MAENDTGMTKPDNEDVVSAEPAAKFVTFQ